MSVVTAAPKRTVEYRSVEILLPSPENSLLYRDRNLTNPDRRRLVESIREHGIQSPILVSDDNYVISGHERLGAAIEAGLDRVPTIRLRLRRSRHTADQWLAILREHNTGREKTLDERIREKMVDVAVVDSASQVVDSLVAESNITSQLIELPDEIKRRSRITSISRGFADAILRILNEGDLRDCICNERAIHYRLLPPLNVLTSTRSDGFVYGSPGKDKDSVGALSRMLTRLRLVGEVPWDRITDETRPEVLWETFPGPAEFIEEQVRNLFTGYARDLMQSQVDDYVIVAEKLTIKSFVSRVAARYTIPTVIIRGSSGITARRQIAQRFKRSGKRNLVLLIMTDCDPAGDMIAETTAHSLRDEFGIGLGRIKPIRVAFTHRQADEFGLSSKPGLVVKDSTVTAKFIKKHGRDDCYELEAVSPDTLQQMLDATIRANINISHYNAEVEQQNRDNAEIEVRRRVIRAELGKCNSEFGEDE